MVTKAQQFSASCLALTPMKKRFYSVLKKASQTGFPVIPGIHHILLGERKFRRGPLRLLASKLYYEPLLKLSCRSIGAGLFLYEDMPKILGNLDITLGNRVSLSGEQV